MPIENSTANRGYLLPASPNSLKVDVARLIAAMVAIDVDMQTALVVAGVYAQLASPAFTGTPTAPTADSATNSNQIATTAFVQAKIAELINSAPGLLDTMSELSAAINNDPDFYNTILTALAGKAALEHTHALADLTDATANAKALMAAANYAAMRALLDLEAGVDFYSTTAVDTLLGNKPDTGHTHNVSALADASADAKSLLQAADYATMVGLLGAGGDEWTYMPVETPANGLTWTGIPSGVREIELLFSEFKGSTVGGNIGIRIGDSGGIEATGYNSTGGGDSTTCFLMRNYTTIGYGTMRIANITGNHWMSYHLTAWPASAAAYGSGGKTLSGELTQVQLVAISGAITATGYVLLRYR